MTGGKAPGIDMLARMAVANLFTRKRLGAFLARQSADDLRTLAMLLDQTEESFSDHLDDLGVTAEGT